MKFTCTKENLSHALQLVGPLAGKQANLPILTHVLLRVSESRLEVATTNLEVALRVYVRAKVDSPGAWTVPAKTLTDYVQLLTGEQVECRLEEQELLVSCTDSKTKIKGVGADEFPVLPEVEEEHAYSIEAAALKDGLSQVVVAAAKNEIRPELAGVYFGFHVGEGKRLVMAATDSYRLAERKLPLTQGGDAITCIVSARSVYEMIRVLGLEKGGGETQARLWASSNQIALRFHDIEMVSRVIDGQYPDYTQIIPTAFKTTAVFPVDTVVNKIKAASLFTTTGVNAVSFDMNVADKTIGISSTSTQTGEHSSTVDATVEGEENSILLNHRYVLDGLQHMENDIEFAVNSPDAPCLFRPKDNQEYTYIVMPIRQ